MNYQILEGLPYPLGVSRTADGINIAFDLKEKQEFSTEIKEVGVIFYHTVTKQEILRVPFSKEGKTGSIFSLCLKSFAEPVLYYNFYWGKDVLRDPYGRRFIDKISVFEETKYNWKGDKPLGIPYSNSVLYCLHVKGFTFHHSSKVEHPGCYRGITEKISYLKNLGITAIELLPAYEFDLYDELPKNQNLTLEQAMKNYHLPMKTLQYTGEPQNDLEKINYWGFKKGYYFAPNSRYGGEHNPCLEFKEMVQTAHKNGIEIIMQFFFPKDIAPGYILEVLKYWLLEYHVDGFHLKGEKIPMNLLGTEPMLRSIKLIHDFIPVEDIYEEREVPKQITLGEYHDYYMIEMRKFLKGDENQLSVFMELLNKHPEKNGILNYITNYYGFTLADLFSYDCKHNEANQEENHDGMEFNYSWNCGVEGKTNKRKILTLRKKQMMNAIAILLMSQGTPVINSGDEFGRTQSGNNNPYCQDNEISWIDWKLKTSNKEFFNYVRSFLEFRKENQIFHMPGPLRQMDYRSFGYPDVSFHGENAWEMNFHPFHRSISVLYCNKYISLEEKDNSFFYVAYNMNWNSQEFSIPRIPKKFSWEIIKDTSALAKDSEVAVLSTGETAKLLTPPRSICILKGIIKE